MRLDLTMGIFRKLVRFNNHFQSSTSELAQAYLKLSYFPLMFAFVGLRKQHSYPDVFMGIDILD